MKKSILYFAVALLSLTACQPSESYLHLIFNITDNVKAVITINTSRHCRAALGEEEIGILSLDLSSAETQSLNSITLRSAAHNIVGRVESADSGIMHPEDGGSNIIAISGIDAEITTVPTSFHVAMLPYAFTEGDISIDLEFEGGKQTLLLPAFTLEQGMDVCVECRL